MTINSESLISILIIVILLLFTGLLFQVGRHTRSNIWLGIYFISQIVALFNMTFPLHPMFIYCLFQSVIFSWGAFYYLFVSSLLNPAIKFKPVYLWHFVSVPIGFFLLLITFDTGVNLYFQTNAPILSKNSMFIQEILFNVLIVGYNIATVFKYYQYKAKVKKGLLVKISVKPVWINTSIWGFVGSCFLNQIGYYLNRIIPNQNFNWTIIGLTAFLIYFCVLFYVAVSSRTLTEKFEVKEKYKNSSLNENEAMQLLSKLDDFMQNNKPFINPDLKLKEMSDLLHTSERNISQIVNTYKNQNFSDYVNTYRVECAKSLLTNPSLKEKTILWVLFEAGFNSKTTFNTTFKKLTGFTPAEYRKNHTLQK